MELANPWSTTAPALVGVVLGAALTALLQYLNTRQQWEAQRRDRRKERLLDALTALLEHSDPEANKPLDYGPVARLISRSQLLLDLEVPAEKQLNGALNHLGNLADAYVKGSFGSGEPRARGELLLMHGQVLALIRHYRAW